MAKYSSANCAWFYVSGQNLLPDLTEVEDKTSPITQDTTPLGTNWLTPTCVGINEFTLSVKGFYDDAAGALNAAIVGSLGQAQLVAFGPANNLTGQSFLSYAAPLVSSYDRQAAIKKFHLAPVTYAGSGPIEPGRIVLPRTVSTSAVNTAGTPVNNGAATTNGGAGILHVEAVTLGGYTSWTVTIRHSADDITYADLVVFAIVTTAPQGQRVVVSGTVNQYLDAQVSLQGSGSAPSLTAMVGFARY